MSRALPLRDVSPRPRLRPQPTLVDRALDAAEALLRAAVPVLAAALACAPVVSACGCSASADRVLVASAVDAGLDAARLSWEAARVAAVCPDPDPVTAACLADARARAPEAWAAWDALAGAWRGYRGAVERGEAPTLAEVQRAACAVVRAGGAPAVVVALCPGVE